MPVTQADPQKGGSRLSPGESKGLAFQSSESTNLEPQTAEKCTYLLASLKMFRYEQLVRDFLFTI